MTTPVAIEPNPALPCPRCKGPTQFAYAIDGPGTPPGRICVSGICSWRGRLEEIKCASPAPPSQHEGTLDTLPTAAVTRVRQADAAHLSDVCALADEQREALKTIAVKADGLATSLALVCGSKAVPAKFRRALETVGETVQEIAEIATVDGRPPAPSAPAEEPAKTDDISERMRWAAETLARARLEAGDDEEDAEADVRQFLRVAGMDKHVLGQVAHDVMLRVLAHRDGASGAFPND